MTTSPPRTPPERATRRRAAAAAHVRRADPQAELVRQRGPSVLLGSVGVTPTILLSRPSFQVAVTAPSVAGDRLRGADELVGYSAGIRSGSRRRSAISVWTRWSSSSRIERTVSMSWPAGSSSSQSS